MDCSLPGSSVCGVLQVRIHVLPCLPPGDHPDPEVQPTSLISPALQEVSLLLASPGKLCTFCRHFFSFCVLIQQAFHMGISNHIFTGEAPVHP